MTTKDQPVETSSANRRALPPGELSSASARRVQDALAARGLALCVVELPDSARTAPEAARAVGCHVAQIVKSLIFRGRRTERPVLIIVSGANRVDERRMADLLGEPIDKPDAEYVREQTGFAIGGVPPCGHARPLVTFIDQDLLVYDELWAAAGTPHAVFKLTPADLTLLTNGSVVQVT